MTSAIPARRAIKTLRITLDYNALAVTVFTGALALLALFQWLAMRKQAKYMRDSLKITERTADAAKQGADAATEAVKTSLMTERAIVLVENVRATTQGEAFGLESYSVVVFTLKNFGRTIAYSVELSGALTGVGKSPIEQMPPTTIAPQGTNSWLTKSLGAWIDEPTLSRVNNRQSLLEYKIDVTYSDSFKQPHRYHCEGRYEPALKQFLITASTSD